MPDQVQVELELNMLDLGRDGYDVSWRWNVVGKDRQMSSRQKDAHGYRQKYFDGFNVSPEHCGPSIRNHTGERQLQAIACPNLSTSTNANQAQAHTQYKDKNKQRKKRSIYRSMHIKHSNPINNHQTHAQQLSKVTNSQFYERFPNFWIIYDIKIWNLYIFFIVSLHCR